MEFIEQFIGDEFLSKAFVLSIITGSLVYLRNFPKLLWQRIKRYIVFSITIEQTDELFDYVEKWLVVHYSGKYRNVLAHVNYRNFAINGDERDTPRDTVYIAEQDDLDKIKKETVSYRHNQDVIFIRKKGIFIRISKGRDKLENAKSLRDLYFDKYNLSTFFFKKKLQCFIDDVVEFNQQFKRDEKRIGVFISDGYGNYSKMREVNSKHIDNIIIDEKDKSDLISDILWFSKSKEWHDSRSIPYKRGYLFYGSPGNGKTSMALAVANHTQRDIYSLSLGDIENDAALKRAFMNAGGSAVILIEDVDVVFNKRKRGDNISLSSLLNCLDGVFYKDGLITILTTNCPEKLDGALTREGRVDLKIEFNNPKEKEVRQYIELFYGIHLNGELYAKEEISMAEIQGHCMRKSEKEIRKFLFQPEKTKNYVHR